MALIHIYYDGDHTMVNGEYGGINEFVDLLCPIVSTALSRKRNSFRAFTDFKYMASDHKMEDEVAASLTVLSGDETHIFRKVRYYKSFNYAMIQRGDTGFTPEIWIDRFYGKHLYVVTGEHSCIATADY